MIDPISAYLGDINANSNSQVRAVLAEQRTAAAGTAIKERQLYVPAQTIEDMLPHCPNDEWRLLICLSRYLGLRVPSEPLSLRWNDIDFENQRLRVPSPKTEKSGKSFRNVPIVTEVRRYLDRVWDAAPPGAEFVLHRIRERMTIQRGFWQATNLLTHLERIIGRAGHTT